MKKQKLTSSDLIADIANFAALPKWSKLGVGRWRESIAQSFSGQKWGKSEWFYLIATADLTGWIYENSPILAWTQCATVDDMAQCFDGFPGWKYRGDYVPQNGETCLISTLLADVAKSFEKTGRVSKTHMDAIPCDWNRVFDGLGIVYPNADL